MKNIPNYISLLRIVLSATLLLLNPLGKIFWSIYFMCGVSDILDGYIARRIKVTSQLGARLDSAADLLLVIVLVYALYPIIVLQTSMFVWIAIIVGIRSASLVVVFLKYRTFAILHTYGNKVTGIALFILLPLYIYFKFEIIVYILCLLGSLSAFEELVVHLSSKEIKVDQKSIFGK